MSSQALPMIAEGLTAVLRRCAREGAFATAVDPRDLAGAVARTALSHYIFPDTDRAAVENVIGKYLHIGKQSAAFISLPAFPLGVDAVRLQRVVSSMKRFNLLPRNTNFQITSMIAG